MSVHSAISRSTASSHFSRASSGDSRSSSGRSQLYWKMYRKDVLAPHHVRIVDSVPGDMLPQSILTWIEANHTNTQRFDRQRQQFRQQVASGRGFGSSALFPQEVLPSMDAQPFLARAMVPTLSAEALPERKLNSTKDTVSKLSLPRPGLGCGFSTAAFGPEEINAMPSFLLATGTTVHFATGSISSGSALYCPFLTFERAFSQQEYGLELASNQCAIDGAWSVRSLQMLFAKASGDECDETFERPVSFSCSIDNEVAVINYHWVDHAQTYCMAPVVKFELARDDHFDQFLIWVEAIGQWALIHLLPEIKKAISLLSDYVSSLPALVKSLKQLDTKKLQEEHSLVSALKVSYNSIPWRFEHDDFSPVSSSTASWGSPMINETVFAKFEYPIIPQPRAIPPPRSVCSDSKVFARGVRFATLPREKPSHIKTKTEPNASILAMPKQITQFPAYEKNSELVLTKRLGHAMDEIQDLQAQLQHLRQEVTGSTSCLQNELSGLRKTMTCVVRKEKMSLKQRSPLRTNINGNAFAEAEQRLSIQKGVSVVTTPTDPTARRHWPGVNSPRKPSGLSSVLSVDTSVTTTISTTTTSAVPGSAAECQSPITIFSPTIINMPNNNWDREDINTFVRVPYGPKNVWSPILATHLLSALVPSALLRVILLGCLLDYCMQATTGQHTPTISQYLSQLLNHNIH